MDTPQLANRCGFSLKHETIIIGVVQSIFAFMCLLLSAAYAVHPHELVELTDPSIIPKLDTLRAMLTIIAIASGLQCIFSILLIFGAASNRPILLTPWLLFSPICLFIYIVGTLVAIIHHDGGNNLQFIIGHIITSVTVTLLACYQILTVHSYKQYLRRMNF